MPLVAPLPADHDAELAALAAALRTTLGTVPNSLRTMQLRPALARAVLALNTAAMECHGRVTAEQKRLVATLASQVAGCRYCQAHSIMAAERAGASAARLRAIWEFRDSPLFTDAEKAAFEFAIAAATVPNGVTPAIAEALRAHWDDGEIVEILGVVSLYGFLNRWNDSMGTTLEHEGIAAGNRHLAHLGWEQGKHV
jgi:uncharacterized peroxidase-related enzyme